MNIPSVQEIAKQSHLASRQIARASETTNGWRVEMDICGIRNAPYENINTDKGENMNTKLKKYLVASLLMLSFGIAQPVTAAPETQIAMTQATNTAIANLEAALKAVTANKLAEAQDYIDVTRDSASDILGRCSIEAKKERGSTALRNARRQIKSGDKVGATVSLKEAIEIFKFLLVSVNKTEQPSVFKWLK
jgi:hypothetical protein